MPATPSVFSPEAGEMLRRCAQVALSHAAARYLMANAHGRWDGAEKAIRHQEMCSFYAAALLGLPDPDSLHMASGTGAELLCSAIHTATQALTDNLDTAIGFPLEASPDYDALTPLFLQQFHQLAWLAASTWVGSAEEFATSFNPHCKDGGHACPDCLMRGECIAAPRGAPFSQAQSPSQNQPLNP